MNEQNYQLEGINSVLSALKTDQNVKTIIISESAKPARMQEIVDLAQKKRIQVEYSKKYRLDNMSLTNSHHGVIAVVDGERQKAFEEVADEVMESCESPLFVLLDGIQDPHNLGAIIRTAECAGASCVVVPERRSAKVTAVAANASAGAINLIPVTYAKNINRAIEYLQEKGVWVIGTDAGGKNYDEADYKGKMAIVMGSEGEGLHRLTSQKCDDIVGIRMYGNTTSLNVSVAAGVVLFEAAKQRNGI